MAFLRVRHFKRKGKTYSYLVLEERYRVSGKVKSKSRHVRRAGPPRGPWDIDWKATFAIEPGSKEIERLMEKYPSQKETPASAGVSAKSDSTSQSSSHPSAETASPTETTSSNPSETK